MRLAKKTHKELDEVEEAGGEGSEGVRISAISGGWGG